MSGSIVYVGLDVHKDTIVIAVADDGGQPAQVFGTIAHEWARLKKTLTSLAKPGLALKVCYEAGPTGYGLYRRCQEAGIDCVVVAPSLTPRKPGMRVKTDRRDARNLAHFLRSGDLTAVWVPDEVTEGLRDLERCRDDAKKAERVARHQLSKFLLRHDRRWTGKTSWTKKHLAWIGSQRFEQPAAQRVLHDYLKTVEDCGERVARLTADIAELVETTALAPLVQGFQALRGVSLITATVVAAELGDIRRFGSAPDLMAYVGLVPSEHSSGQTKRRGAITRAGNSHVRRVLVEAAWSYRFAPRMSRELRRRNQPVSEEIQKIAWKAQKRLHRRLKYLLLKGKNHQQAITAVARELAGFIWAIGQQEECRVA